MLEQSEAEWEQFRSLSVGEEAEVANAHEAWRQQVQQEASEELIRGECHDGFAVAMRGISPAEADVSVGESNQPVVGDGNTMGVSAQITQHVFGSTERWFGVDNPVLAKQETEPTGKGSWLGKRCERTAELECALVKSTLECGDELTTEEATKDLLRQEEGIMGGDPARVIGSEAAGGDYTVHMRVMTPTPTVP